MTSPLSSAFSPPDLMVIADRNHPLATAPPVQLLVRRLDAFGAGNFAVIYDSYHPAAPFLRLHPDRSEYLAFAITHIKDDFTIAMCRVLQLEERGDTAVVIVHMQVSFRGESQEYLELCRLRRLVGGWTYHSGLKRPRSDFPVGLDNVTMQDFSGIDERFAI
jgi:SEC-C motif-containing protein